MRVPRYRIVLQKEGSVVAEGYRRLTKSSDAVAVAQAMLEGSDRERFLAIALDSKNHVQAREWWAWVAKELEKPLIVLHVTNGGKP